MASLFGHGFAAIVLSKLGRSNKMLFGLAVLSAIIPDADVIGFQYGISYHSMWGHRGITHSILFAVLWALLLSYTFGKQQKLRFFLVLFSATVSHTLLDAMTSGGLGVALWAPFDNTRIFFPFRPIRVSPLGIANFFTERAFVVLRSEAIWIGIPGFILLGILSYIKKSKDDN